MSKVLKLITMHICQKHSEIEEINLQKKKKMNVETVYYRQSER
jgi:hypothetical protein